MTKAPVAATGFIFFFVCSMIAAEGSGRRLGLGRREGGKGRKIAKDSGDPCAQSKPSDFLGTSHPRVAKEAAGTRKTKPKKNASSFVCQKRKEKKKTLPSPRHHPDTKGETRRTLCCVCARARVCVKVHTVSYIVRVPSVRLGSSRSFLSVTLCVRRGRETEERQRERTRNEKGRHQKKEKERKKGTPRKRGEKKTIN